MPTPSLRSLALVGVLAVTLSGCSVIESIFPAQAERDEETQEVQSAGEADVFTIALGDCMNDQSADEIDSVPAVPCSEPHDLEVYSLFDIPGDEFPGLDAIYTAADDGCYAAFPGFVGIAYEDSVLDFSSYTPTEASWESGDHEVVCLIFDQAPNTGTLAGAAR